MQSNETNPTWYFGLGHEGHLSNFDLSKVNDLHSTSYEICRTLGASSRTCLLIRKHRIQTLGRSSVTLACVFLVHAERK